MSFPRYPEYKDSGVEWLGDLPAHWEALPLKRISPQQTVGIVVNPSEYVSDEGLPFIYGGDISEGRIDYASSRRISEANSRRNEKTRLAAGDLLTVRVGAPGITAVVPMECEGGNCASVMLVRRGEFTSGWLCYAMNSRVLRYQVEIVQYGAAQEQFNIKHAVEFVVPTPPRIEQTAIATFLDRETAKIDALVTEQAKLIALLQEKRQAVISHAVTKGLDPNVPMKDSGVEWLGEVPGHWKVNCVKHLVATLEQGWSPQCESFPVQSDDEWGVLKVGCVNGGVFRPEENKTLPPELEPVPELGVAAGDLLISRANTRELVGGAAVALLDYPRLMLCDKLYRLRFRPETCEPVFLALYLGTPKIRGQIELAATGASSSMLNIGQSTILELDIAMPPIGEQLQILNAVSDQIDTADDLVAQARTAITLLQERRSALISAAVTGQIDVRGMAGGSNAPDLIASSAYTASV